jgi:predicted metal-dependent hydrolase
LSRGFNNFRDNRFFFVSNKLGGYFRIQTDNLRRHYIIMDMAAVSVLYSQANMVEKKATRRVTLGVSKTNLDGVAVSYTLKRGPRCRQSRLEVTREAGLIAIIPRRYDLKKLPAFLAANQRWILAALKRYCSAPIPPKGPPVPVNTIPYMGNYLEIRRGNNGPAPVRLVDGQLLVGAGLPGNGRLAEEILGWYRGVAGALIRGKAAGAGSRMGLKYRRINLKEMRTRWGSCSLKGNLNFNWKLILMPEPVIEYVVIHELAHLKEMHHGPDFWARVARECPDWRERRKWLTRNGREYVAAFERSLTGQPE